VTATSFGPRFRPRRQRAANSSSAVESGPPETARMRAEVRASGPNSVFASAAETAASAADTLLFSLDPLFHARRCAREFALHLAERRAGRLFLAQQGERLPEAKQRIRRLGAGFEFGRDVEESFRGIAEALALEQTLAHPIGGVAGQPIVGIFGEEAAEAVFGERVVAAQNVAVGEFEFVARALRRRQRRGGRRAGIGAARRRRRGGEIERRTAGAAAGRADRRFAQVGRRTATGG